MSKDSSNSQKKDNIVVHAFKQIPNWAYLITLTFFLGIVLSGAYFSAQDSIVEQLPRSDYINYMQPYFNYSFDGRTKGPNWVIQVLSSSVPEGPSTRELVEDQEIDANIRSSLNDYIGSGYDPVPLIDVSKVRSCCEALPLSIASPMNSTLKSGLWAKLEEHMVQTIDKYKVFRALVICGPLYLPEGNRVSYEVIGASKVAVPTHFFKVIYYSAPSNLGDYKEVVVSEAFIFPNRALSYEKDIDQYKVPESSLQKISGIRFPVDVKDYVKEVMIPTRAL